MMAVKNDFISEISTYFAFSGEKVPGKSEDSYIYSFNERKGLIGVFDGCGGIGSKRYQLLDSATGAYISSRIVGESTAEWFDAYSGQEYIADKTKSLGAKISDTLNVFSSAAGTSKIKGAMTKSFPTTASITVIEAVDGKMCADFIWAGDSRGFLLDSKGLVQITRDDIDISVDALDNISDDGVLTNFIAAGEKYTLHSQIIPINRKCLVFNATDGCFGYLRTPMEFEYLILYTMLCSENVVEWRDKLKESIGRYSGDDYTMSLAAFGFENFDSIKKYFSGRANSIYEKYIIRLDNADDEQIAKLWNDYKTNYYGEGDY